MTDTAAPAGDRFEPAALFADVERIASLGPRYCGTPAEARARELLTAEFTAAGLRNVRQERFSCPACIAGTASCRVEAKTGDDALGRLLPCTALQGTAAGRVCGPAVFLGDGSPAAIDAARTSVDLAGRIAIVRTGLLYPIGERLVEHDIAALVHVGGTSDGLLAHFVATFYPPRREVLPFPGVSVEAQAGLRLLTAVAAGPVRLEVAHDVSHTETATANVVGDWPGADGSDECVVVGAHYDTQRDSPGASDNATGLAALLALARNRSRLPAYRTMRFVAFAAEEPGAWGAIHHVAANDHTGTVAMINFDALGSPIEATRSIIATPGLVTIARERAATTGWLAGHAADARAFPYTDMAPFADAGIETCMLWRYPPPHPYYHSSGDIPAFVDPVRLAEDARAGAAVADALASRDHVTRMV